jgi:hypothetical protein
LDSQEVKKEEKLTKSKSMKSIYDSLIKTEVKEESKTKKIKKDKKKVK